MSSIGETLVKELERRNVQCVFGIPGVHTIELYRGLASSTLRHITPRHEQGAGFMADGYARVSGKPGVAFVITGPGLTNTITAMLQARADSVPMLVICGANEASSLGKGWGHLHEMPNQSALAAEVASISKRIKCADQLLPALDTVFASFQAERPGPALIEIPLDIAGMPYTSAAFNEPATKQVAADTAQIMNAKRMLEVASTPVIIIGGGARHNEQSIQALAEALDAPVVQTTNARGVMHQHELIVPASPSLLSVRTLIEAADVVLALGTELGQTDFDMYASGSIPTMKQLIRVDCSAKQLAAHPAELSIRGDVGDISSALLKALTGSSSTDTPAQSEANENLKGAVRASGTKRAAWDEIGDALQSASTFLTAIQKAVPNAILVGDSTQPIYAGNLYYDHDRVGGWFNAATGFGALGYGIPAAIGASIAEPDATVICITGDGGAQFSLPEIMTAVDEHLPIVFLIWNNHGYQEIATSMQAVDIEVVGCNPTPPDFSAMAKAFGVPYWSCTTDTESVQSAIGLACDNKGPTIVDVAAPNLSLT